MVLTKDRIIRAVRLRVCRNVFFDVNTHVRNSILVCGSGRSGTTWLGEMINSRNEFRTVFEPFHPDRVRAWAKYPQRCYLRSTDDDESIFEAASMILSGKIRDAWPSTHNTKFLATKRIIKEISINNSLPYIKTKFPDLKIVFIHRDPFSVARSRLKLGWHRESDPSVVTDLSVFTSQPLLMSDYLHPFKQILLDKTLTDLEKEIAFWCAENYIPLNHMEEDATFLKVSYERLVVDPAREFARVFSFLNLTSPRNIEKKLMIPSTTTSDALRTEGVDKDGQGGLGRSKVILQQFDLLRFSL